jgi:hypothetical protein
MPPQWRTPGGDGEERSEEDDYVDALAALFRPVGHGIEVEPQREFIECECCADAVADGEKTAEEDRPRRGFGADFGEGSVSSKEQQQDAPDQMVDVTSAHLHISKGADVVGDGGDQQTHPEEGDEKADRCQEQPAMRAIRYLLMDEVTEFGEVEQQKQDGSNDESKDQQNPRSGDVVHGSRLSGDADAEAMAV